MGKDPVNSSHPMIGWTWETLESGLATVSKGINAKRELIVLSDFRKSDWADTGSSFLNLKKRMKAEPLKPVLTFIDVGGPAEENLSVEKIELSAHSIGIGQKVLIRAEFATMARPDTREIL